MNKREGIFSYWWMEKTLRDKKDHFNWVVERGNSKVGARKQNPPPQQIHFWTEKLRIAKKERINLENDYELKTKWKVAQTALKLGKELKVDKVNATPWTNKWKCKPIIRTRTALPIGPFPISHLSSAKARGEISSEVRNFCRRRRLRDEEGN